MPLMFTPWSGYALNVFFGPKKHIIKFFKKSKPLILTVVNVSVCSANVAIFLIKETKKIYKSVKAENLPQVANVPIHSSNTGHLLKLTTFSERQIPSIKPSCLALFESILRLKKVDSMFGALIHPRDIHLVLSIGHRLHNRPLSTEQQILS